MTSGSITGASTVTIQNGSTLGSSSSAITINSTSGAITVDNSTVYGALTAPNYSTVNVSNGGAVYGTCQPNSTPANACSSSPPAPVNCSNGLSSGITGSYYNNRLLTEPATATRLDAPIDFAWGSGVPGPAGVGADGFSTRWSGYIRVTQSGAYRFQTVSDDGVRLSIGGNLVINNWTDHSAATNTTGDINLVAGQTYSVVLEYYENGGDATIRLQWRLPGASTYVAIPGGPTPTLGAGLYECTPVSVQPISSCPTGANLVAGITGNYFNNQTLTAPAAATRVDGPIYFDWGTGAPGPTVIGANTFSVQWNGYVQVTQSGLHRFQTNSDDGVRLTVNGVLLIDQWNDHSVTTHTSAALNLQAGKAYPIKVEFYENSGFAVMQLAWQTPGNTSYVAIPIGVNANPVTSAGLYQCNTVASYKISHSGTGITCAGEVITFTALDAAGNPIAPANGTTITLGTTSTASQWVGGNSATFDGVVTEVKKVLRQPSAATVNINVIDNNGKIESIDPSIVFADAALKFSDMPTEVAGIVDNNPTLRAIRTDPNTGVCVPQLNGDRTTRLAFSCINPTSCINGQKLTLNNLEAKANNIGSTITYNSVTLNFNASGIASIPFKYTDVGQVQLHAQVDLPGSTNDPAVTLVGNSNSFTVKPHAIVVTGAVQTLPPYKANPGGTSIAAVTAQFVAANEPFNVSVEARNGAAPAALTPNFGREIQPETKFLKIKTKSLVYPSGGTATALAGIAEPASTMTQGAFLFSNARWNQVGSILIEPYFDDNDPATTNDGDYLGGGDILNLLASPTVGRFYPDHFLVTKSELVNSCTTFSYIGQPASLKYTVEAREYRSSSSSTTSSTSSSQTSAALTNYNSAYVNGVNNLPVLTYVAENNNSGTDLGGRVNDGVATKSWTNGSLTVEAPNAVFGRLSSAPFVDGPYPSTQIGIKLADNFDFRRILPSSLDMDAASIGNCSVATCSAKQLGSTLNLRYGRLRLDDAFGPETANLPVNFVTEFWAGSFFVTNVNDSCTKILRSAIIYPAGSILSPSNLTVALTGGSTTGSYSSMSTTEVGFTNGNAQHFFTAPTGSGQGSFNVNVDLTSYPWLRFDWNQDGNYSDTALPTARFGFGQYRGHDRVIYWREKFN
ncbi:MAG TPA: DUF6701 domain-containing protein [Cellvibrio sp.]|nr:DUF6701 domain-containing protein [Cellvibrio sp.]